MGISTDEHVGRATPLQPEPGSFRDRDNRVFRVEDQVLRVLGPRAAADWQAVCDIQLDERLIEEGVLIPTARLEVDQWPEGLHLPASQPSMVLTHQRVPFLSWPYEWTFGMLREAAQLQLQLLESALDSDMILKDATPYNIQWRGTQPVFIDVCSLGPYEQGFPWLAYGQFCQLFLNPLLLQARTGMQFRTQLRGSLEGIPTTDLRACVGWRHVFRSGVFFDVITQSRLIRRQQRKEALSGESIVREFKESGFNISMIRRNVQRLQRIIEKTKWTPPRTVWTTYADTKTYEQQENEQKQQLIDRVARAEAPRLVWDLGCNDGMYSRIAARYAETVVALDQDESALEALRLGLRADGISNVLTLVGDLADPSPSQGWRNAERASLQGRATPDLVLALALVHHLSITSNVPLQDVVGWLRSLDSLVVVEFPTRSDQMVQRLLQNKPDADHADYSLELFERELGEVFEIEHREELASGTRVLFVARPRQAVGC